MKNIPLALSRATMTAVFAFCALTSAYEARSQAPDPRERQITLKIGDDAPKLEVGRWVKGKPIERFEKGHVYVFDFWATWCVPCREGMPHMSQLAKQYSGKASFIAMNVSEATRPGRDPFVLVDSFVRMMGDKMDMHVAMDGPDGKVNTAWMRAAGLGSLPSVIIVDQHGKIAWTGGGGRAVDTVIAKVVAGTFDAHAHAHAQERAAAQGGARRGGSDAAMPMRQALRARDYALVISLYDKAVAANPAEAEGLREVYYPALAHVDPDQAYKGALEVKGSEGEYGLARALVAEEGLQARFYEYVADYYTRRAANDFFAMGSVAEARFKAGDVAKAIEIQRQFIRDLNLPTTPSTDGYVARAEETLRKYEAALAAEPLK